MTITFDMVIIGGGIMGCTTSLDVIRTYFDLIVLPKTILYAASTNTAL